MTLPIEEQSTDVELAVLRRWSTRRKSVIVGAGSAVVLAGAVAAAFALSSGGSLTLRGSIAINDYPAESLKIFEMAGGDQTALGLIRESTERQGSTCQSVDYRDIRGGATVTVTDDKGAIVGLTELDAGQVTDLQPKVGIAPQDYVCVFHWTIKAPSRPFYKVEISHRGALTFTRSQAQHGSLDTQLGS